MSYRRLLSCLLALCLMAHSALAASDISDWGNVRILDVGTLILVKTKSGEKYHGHLKRVTADSLSVVVSIPHSLTQVIELRKDEVREVEKKISQKRSSVIGSIVGLGIGIGIGHIVDSRHKGYNEDPGLGKLSFGITGLFLGTAAGAVFGLKGRKVYRAP